MRESEKLVRSFASAMLYLLRQCGRARRRKIDEKREFLVPRRKISFKTCPAGAGSLYFPGSPSAVSPDEPERALNHGHP
jgi:hypothetical protein